MDAVARMVGVRKWYRAKCQADSSFSFLAIGAFEATGFVLAILIGWLSGNPKVGLWIVAADLVIVFHWMLAGM
ncbi:hypothetical protein EPO05_04990 [Patescibacteria group bacterium]|nr:MAG: hypothetical protein EPO05_04990 [Patescibacteria group bacterium]